MILIFLGKPSGDFGSFSFHPSFRADNVCHSLLDGEHHKHDDPGGLALAFSRIIDNSVISLENIYRHLETGATAQVAAEKGGAEVSMAVLAATLTTVVVFFPVMFLYGVSKFLFSALAIAVVISLFASYFVAMTGDSNT